MTHVCTVVSPVDSKKYPNMGRTTVRRRPPSESLDSILHETFDEKFFLQEITTELKINCVINVYPNTFPVQITPFIYFTEILLKSIVRDCKEQRVP